ncbi:MAG: tRNA (guanosine(37)-N1)-methyltransferase TrmD [Planctomycetaceae bacterium]|nr:tRNA (guanosine(37)-N1)-methyltransferase TrmD [Planctomycetota bacterium]NUO15919.1 tRNA (guanosine(37)-N1)-methyltransferase TrmD [Planctomycetaceae bacterium]GIK53636.1 MAG: tRNA (guanine-N(1)-)-methyltransferase [Planctomycetota bacterium]
MRFDILTLFPAMVHACLSESIPRIAAERGAAEYRVTNFRDYATGVHQSVDDRPYGGGPGMVLKCEPLFKAVRDVQGQGPPAHLVLLTPQGRVFNQGVARELAHKPRLLMLCGRYEGFDERIREGFAWDEISIGDFVLSGGELAALVIVDAVVRLLPGVLGDDASTLEESFGPAFEGRRLEYPQYTRPSEFEGMKVPEVLLGGHHAEIAKWRHEQALKRTQQRRPDLLQP